ncbi:MAG: hypothetical protein ACTHMG_12730 [Sphingomonas sp.]
MRFSVIVAKRDAMLRVIDDGLPVRLYDETSRCQSTVPRLCVGDENHIAVYVDATLLKGESPVPAVERSDASAFGCRRLNCSYLPEWRLSGGTTSQVKDAEQK